MATSSECSPLIGGSESGQVPVRNRIDAVKKAINCNRVIIVMLLAAISAVAIVFQQRIVNLSMQLTTEENKITDLEGVVKSQAKVIKRFNESVSNADVLQKLQALEQSLYKTQSDLETEIHDFTDTVGAKLNNTMKELDDTVKKAEGEITHEVDIVKTDFQKYMVDTQAQFSMENSFMVYQIAGTLVLLSCLISSWHMSSHLRKFRQPAIQRKILAILWMSPIYAITSWFSLVFTSAEGYLAIIKDAYEAYIIYQFLSFCIAVLGKGDRDVVVDLLAQRADHLSPPFRICGLCCKEKPFESNRQLADAVLLQCQFFALQFVFFRPLTTIATVFLNKYHCYGPFGATSANDYRAPQMYITMIQNISIFTAFTGLLKFYHAVDKDLSWCRPFAKFLCIKGVVFMTFWQGLAIAILAETTEVGGPDTEQWAKSSQNFLICLEMLIFSIAHFYCFPVEEWEPNYRADFNKGKFSESLALGDFMADLKLVMRSSRRGGKKRKNKTDLSKSSIPEETSEDVESNDAEITQRDDSNVDNNDGNLDNDDTDETDEDDDATAASTIIHTDSTDDGSVMSETNDIEHAISSAISKQAQDTRNPEVKVAARRILKQLSTRLPKKETPQEVDGLDNIESTHSDNDAQAPKQDDPEQVSETTSLLGSPRDDKPAAVFAATTPTLSQHDRVLRPSIFTTIADIAADEDASESAGGP